MSVSITEGATENSYLSSESQLIVGVRLPITFARIQKLLFKPKSPADHHVLPSLTISPKPFCTWPPSIPITKSVGSKPSILTPIHKSVFPIVRGCSSTIWFQDCAIGEKVCLINSFPAFDCEPWPKITTWALSGTSFIYTSTLLICIPDNPASILPGKYCAYTAEEPPLSDTSLSSPLS